MKIELLYFGGCPGWRKAARALNEALALKGHGASFEAVAVETDAEAQRLRFPGSPTIRVDGHDLFPVGERGHWHLGCRVYATPEGLKDHPTAEMIQARLAPTG